MNKSVPTNLITRLNRPIPWKTQTAKTHTGKTDYISRPNSIK